MWPWWARIPPEDFTDVTPVIEDNDDPDDDEPDEPDDLMTSMKVLCWMFLGPAIWINRFANFEYISVSTIDLLGPGQHISNIHVDIIIKHWLYHYKFKI